MRKKLIMLTLTGLLAITTLAGCSKLEDTDVIVTVDKKEITAGIANFYARYTQAQVGSYASAYMGEDMWSTDMGDGKTYEESIKADILKNLETMYLLEAHMKKYKVSISEEEKAAIKAVVEEFDAANGLAEKETVSGESKNVERVLTLMTIEQKMQAAIKADADKEVSDEEAAQKKMQYVTFAFTTQNEDGTTKELTDDEKKELKKTAKAFAKGAKEAKDFAAYAKEQSLESADATFSAASTTPSTELAQAADKLKEGETTDLIESDNGYYVAKVTSLFDEEATKAEKANIVTERENTLYQETTEKWIKKADIKVNKKAWKKVNFQKLDVTMKQTEEIPYAEDVKTEEQTEQDDKTTE